MQTRAPIGRRPSTLTLGRGWALPAIVLAIVLASSYLPAHGVTGLVDVLAATIAALGLAAASLAAPRWARAAVLVGGGPVVVIGVAPGWQAPSVESARRRIVAVAVGSAASAAGLAAAALLLMASEIFTTGHAVLLVAVYANAALLLSNLVPMPLWPGWTLLLAVLDLRPKADEPSIDRAVPIARGVIVAEAAALAALAISIGDWMLLLVAGLLVWQGWLQTTVARADDLIGRYLSTRRVRNVAREVSATAAPDEPALAAIVHRASDGAVIAVRHGDALLGAIGPRQAAAVAPSERRTRCADIMVSVRDLELLRPEAPALTSLPQLERFGFALTLEHGRLGYVEASDLLNRILLTAVVAHSVRTDKDLDPPPSTGGSTHNHNQQDVC